MAGNSQRRGAIQKTNKKGATVGSGGQRRRGLEGKGPTPRAEDRPYHKAYRSKQLAERAASKRSGGGTQPRKRGAGDAEWIIGRNPVVEALREGVPANAVYVAEGAERDGRLREAFQLAAELGIGLLEVSKPELDRLTGFNGHQGLAARVPAYEYAHPADLLDRAAEAAQDALIVVLDHVTAQPGRRGAFGGGLRRPRRGHPRASRRGDDRRCLEDVGRGGRADPGRAGGQRHPRAQGVPGRGLPGDRPGHGR
jgi:23S rRNA (guanosine2251-2'-O)-methyltransferase